jgi:hypothetical protein
MIIQLTLEFTFQQMEKDRFKDGQSLQEALNLPTVMSMLCRSPIVLSLYRQPF